RRDRQGPAPVHRLERIPGEAEEHLSKLTFIGEHERERAVEIADEPALGKPRLVTQELQRLLDQDVDLRGRAAATRIAHELQEASGDLLAAVGLLLDELKVTPDTHNA